MATGASRPWNLSTVPSLKVSQTGTSRRGLNRPDLRVVRRHDHDLRDADRRELAGAVAPLAAEQVADQLGDDGGFFRRSVRVALMRYLDDANAGAGEGRIAEDLLADEVRHRGQLAVVEGL